MNADRKPLLGLALCLAAACSEPTRPQWRGARPEPALSAAQAAMACFGVSGTLVESFAGADIPNNIFYFAGPVTGDLAGTSLTGLTASSNPAGDPPSHVNFGAGATTIVVTGGTVAALQGATLVFNLEQVGRVNPPSVFHSDRLTLASGARRGSLTLHGVFDFGTFTSTSEYRGSICP